MSRRRGGGCACGTDLPGTCPGYENCPYSDYEPPEELDEVDVDLEDDEE